MARSGVIHPRPIPEIEFLFFFYGADRRGSKGRDAETNIEAFENFQPAFHAFVGDLKELAELIHGKGFVLIP
jgi:hypothetical protein